MNMQENNKLVITWLKEEMLDIAKQNIWYLKVGVSEEYTNVCGKSYLPIRLSLRMVE
jgi:hypothetical protein